jgi:hypothetical protein
VKLGAVGEATSQETPQGLRCSSFDGRRLQHDRLVAIQSLSRGIRCLTARRFDCAISLKAHQTTIREPLDLILRANVRHLYTMNLRVEFGSTKPAKSLKRLVGLVLASLKLPSWPRGC